MADQDEQLGVASGKAAQIEERTRDSMPGRRNDLPKGTLGGLPPDPQADENRE